MTTDRRRLRGSAHHCWKGTRDQSRRRYARRVRTVRMPDHPRATSNGHVYEHIVIAEAALGRSLPASAEVHHLNGDPGDNRPSNLVICEDRSYHMMLHRRKRAFDACGYPDWLPCKYCKKHSAPSDPDLYITPNGVHAYHRSCRNSYMRRWVRTSNAPTARARRLATK